MEDEERTEEEIAAAAEAERQLLANAPLVQMVQSINERANRRATDEVLSQLSALGAGEPQRDRLAETGKGRRDPHGTVRVHSRYDTLMLTRPAWERKFRTFEGDAHIAKWFFALANGDHGSLQALSLADREWRKSMLDPDEQDAHERASILEGTPAAGGGLATGTGGALVPVQMANFIIAQLQRLATMRSIARVIPTSRQQITVPVQLVADLASVAQVAEGGSIGVGEPAWSFKVLAKVKTGHRSIISNEMLEDSAFNVPSELGDQVGQSMAVQEDDQFSITGNGTPPNITEALDVNADLGTAGGGQDATALGTVLILTIADMQNLVFQLPKQLRRGAIWVASDAMLAFISSMADGNNRQAFQNLLNAPQLIGEDIPGAIGTLFNRPVVELPVAGDRLYFGAWNRAYLVADGGDIRAAVSGEAGFATDTVHFRFTRRYDGRVGDPNAYRWFDGITSVGTALS